MKALTRNDLRDALYEEVGLSRRESARLVDEAIEEVCACLVAGEAVKISSFGTFEPRDKGQRMGRNPKTGEPAPIPARRVVVFRPSRILKDWIDEGLGAGDESRPAGGGVSPGGV